MSWFRRSVGTNLALASLAVATFIHPGILHTSDDLERMRTHITAGDEPWTLSYNNMTATSEATLPYTMSGPFTYFTRDHSGDQTNLDAVELDSRAAIDLALRFYIEQNDTYAIASVNILDAWASTLTLINGSDVQLGASLPGANLVNAAEILRYEWDGWSADNITIFSSMINDLFVPAAQFQGVALEPFSGNWGSTGEKAMIAYAVFLNDQDLYDLALSYYTTGGSTGEAACGNLPFMIPDSTGQYVESGRDQGHTQFSLGGMAEISQTASSQGDDSIWELLSNRLMNGYEYTNEFITTNNTMPYNSSIVCCNCTEVFGVWTTPSTVDRLQHRPVDEIAYGFYNGVMGLSMPFTKMDIEVYGGDAANPDNAYTDNAEWGTFRFRRTSEL